MTEPSLKTKRLISQLGVVLIAVVAVGLAVVVGLPASFLFLSACALSLAILFVWSSLQGMDREDTIDFEEALALAAPSATEEQKRAVLRTLKDLEYELSVGKISQEDFDQVSAEYRAEAKRLIYEHDEELRGRLESAEKLVESRLKAEAKKTSRKKKKKVAKGSEVVSESDDSKNESEISQGESDDSRSESDDSEDESESDLNEGEKPESESTESEKPGSESTPKKSDTGVES